MEIGGNGGGIQLLEGVKEGNERGTNVSVESNREEKKEYRKFEKK